MDSLLVVGGKLFLFSSFCLLLHQFISELLLINQTAFVTEPAGVTGMHICSELKMCEQLQLLASDILN